MPKIVVVPHSAIVVRRPEKADFQPHSLCPPSLRSKLDKRGLIFSSAHEDAPKPSNVGIDLARRLLRRSEDDHADIYDRKGGIFPVHVENEKRELRRRNTESNLRRRAELDISRPIKSPPAPNAAILEKYGEREAAWKKRSMEIKSKQNDPSHNKRWSLRTWKIQSGRAPTKIPQHYKANSSAQHQPKSRAKRALSFYSQRWSFRPTPEKLNVTRERQAKHTPPVPQYHHASSTTRIANKPTLPPSAPKKAASTGMLRPQVSFSGHLSVPDRHAAQHSALDERGIHPLLHTHPTRYSSSLHTHQENTPMSSPPGPILPPPRVRIIPPSTLIESHNQTVTNTSHSILPVKPPSVIDQKALVKSLNRLRASSSAPPLDLHPALSGLHAMDFVRNELPPLPPPKTPVPGHERRQSAANRDARRRVTIVEHIKFRNPSGATAMRLISPPGLGALACVELWANGKYKRHKTVRPGMNPAHHRFTHLPDFELDGRESVVTAESEGGGKPCGCLEHEAYETVTSGRWVYVGVGRAADGRWVVELWEPVAEAEVGERYR